MPEAMERAGTASVDWLERLNTCDLAAESTSDDADTGPLDAAIIQDDCDAAREELDELAAVAKLLPPTSTGNQSPGRKRPKSTSRSSTDTLDCVPGVADGDAAQDGDALRARALQAQDVPRLLKSAVRRGLRSLTDGPEFTQECHRRFFLLDKNASGYLELEELQRGLGSMFPAAQWELTSDKVRLLPLTTSVEALMDVFDQDADGRISTEEFPPLLRLCQAWRHHQCFSKTRENYRSPRKLRRTKTVGAMTDSSPRRRLSAALGAAFAAFTPTATTPGRVGGAQNSGISSQLPRCVSSTSVVSRSPAVTRPPSASSSQLACALRHSRRQLSLSRSPEASPSEGSTADNTPRPRFAGSPTTFRRSPSQDLRTRPLPPLRRGRSIEDLEVAQLEALEALIEHLGSTRTVSDLTADLLQNVHTRDGAGPFPFEVIAQSAASADALALEENSPPKALLVVRVFRDLAMMRCQPLNDIVGQVLWRSRRAKAIRDTTRLRRVAEDISWIADTGGGDDNIVTLVEGVYNLQIVAEGGKMRWRGWERVVNLLMKNPVLHGRVRHVDADRLYYNAMRRSVPPSCSIGLREFKELLLELADSSAVHPHIVFVAVGSHQKQMALEALEKQVALEAALGAE